MKTLKLKTDYEKACNAYLQVFCEKHDYDYEDARRSWVGGEVGGITECSDLFVEMDDIIVDIDMDAPKEAFIRYYDYCLRVGSIACGMISLPNYRSWLMGCPRMNEAQIVRLEELQKDMRRAEKILKDEIERQAIAE